MAIISISIQSYLNSATILSISIDNASTIAQLKTAVFNAEGTPVAIMEMYYNDAYLVDANSIASYGIVADSYIKTSNNLMVDGLWTKENRQVYKLTLAQLRRRAGGNVNAPYYRVLNTYDITLLPARYVGNVSVPNPHPTGLVEGRPWR